MSEMKMIELRDLLVSAFLSGYGRADSEGLTRREYLDCSLRAIASMQVEPETVYCEEGTALQDELDLDHHRRYRILHRILPPVQFPD